LKPAWANSSSGSWGTGSGGGAQVVGPEFKPQYQKKRTKTLGENIRRKLLDSVLAMIFFFFLHHIKVWAVKAKINKWNHIKF
jgi:hypothetical protein